jgi:hypothetical protein
MEAFRGGRLAGQGIRARAQPGQDEADVAVRQAGLGQAGDGAEHLEDGREVGRRDVGADHPSRARPGQQPFQRRRGPLEQLVEVLGAVGVLQHVDQGAVGGDQLQRLLEEPGQAGPGVGYGGRLLGDGDGPVDALPQVLAGELVLVGEVPVGGSDVDPGVPGDVVQGGVEAAGGEHLRGGVDQLLAVAGGVRPEPPGLTDGRRGGAHQACTATGSESCGSATPGRSSKAVTTAAPA